MGNRSLLRKPKASWFKPYFEEHIFGGLFVFFFRCSSFKTRMKFKKKNPSILSIGFKNETSVFIKRQCVSTELVHGIWKVRVCL